MFLVIYENMYELVRNFVTGQVKLSTESFLLSGSFHT